MPITLDPIFVVNGNITVNYANVLKGLHKSLAPNAGIELIPMKKLLYSSRISRFLWIRKELDKLIIYNMTCTCDKRVKELVRIKTEQNKLLNE